MLRLRNGVFCLQESDAPIGLFAAGSGITPVISILKQALEGFDFTATIRRAYEDGIRIFIEMGPHGSCTRMIRTILQDRPHLAATASMRGESDYLTVLKLLGALIAEGIPVDLTGLYGPDAYPPALNDADNRPAAAGLFTVRVGSEPPAAVCKGRNRPRRLPRRPRTTPTPD